MEQDDEDELEAAFREVDAAIRRADRELDQALIAEGLEEIGTLLQRPASSPAASPGLVRVVRQALSVGARFAAVGNYRDGMGTVVAVLRAVLGEEDDAARAERLDEALAGGLLRRPVPYLEAYVASLAPQLERMSRRDLWDWLASLEGEGELFLGERITWTSIHPGTGRPSREGYLVHSGSGRAIGFRTFSGWLEKFTASAAGH